MRGFKVQVMAVMGLLLFSAAAFSQPPEAPQITGVHVGLADRYRVGLWTQVEIVLQGGSQAVAGEVSAIVPDGDGVPSRVSTAADQPCRLSPGGETRVRLLCRFGRVHGTLRAELRVDGKLVAQRTFETAASPDAEHFLPGLESQGLVVAVGEASVGLEEAVKLASVEPEDRPATARLTRIEQLPTHWYGYEGVDAVILSTSRPEIYGKLAAHGDQVQALDEWVQMGGRLVFCAGAQAEKVLAADGPLRRFAPGRLAKMLSLGRTAAWESYCGSRIGLPQVGNAPVTFHAPAGRRARNRRGPRGRFAAGDPHAARVWASDLRGRRFGPTAAGQVGGSAAAGGQALGPGRRPRRRGRPWRGHDALRFRRSFRPVAQRLGLL